MAERIRKDRLDPLSHGAETLRIEGEHGDAGEVNRARRDRTDFHQRRREGKERPAILADESERTALLEGEGKVLEEGAILIPATPSPLRSCSGQHQAFDNKKVEGSKSARGQGFRIVVGEHGPSILIPRERKGK